MIDIAFLSDGTDRADLKLVFKCLEEVGLIAVELHPKDLAFEMSRDGIEVSHKGLLFESRLVVGWVFEDWLAPGICVLNMLEAAGYRVLNRGNTLFAGQNKAIMSARLAAAGVPHSRVKFSFSPSEVHRMYSAENDSYVVKPGLVISGGITVKASGAGVCRIKGYEAAEAIQTTLENLGQPFYAQQFVERPENRDIRVWIFGNGSAVAVYKVPRSGDWITNTSRGVELRKCELSNDLYNLSKSAADAIGAKIAGIDIAEGKDGLTVLEVNTCPTFLAAQSVINNTVPILLANYLKQICEDNFVGLS